MQQQATTTPRLIAFLRAINVGGHTVKMDQLRALFESLDFESVETYIASGNVIFEAPTEDTQALEQRIEHWLHESLGYAVATFIRSSAEVAAIASYQPFAAAELNQETSRLHVAFLSAQPDADSRQRLMDLQTPIDAFHVHGRELYWLCRTRVSESKFTNVALEKTLGMPATMRNITTVRKLAAKYAAAP